MAVPPSKASTSTISAKVVLLGDSGVGKSSLAVRFVKNKFYGQQETTIGAAYLFRTLAMPPADPAGADAAPRAVKLELWDTAGQERYRSLAPIYYRGAYGALVVYDITSKESLQRAQAWVEELRANADPHLIIFLVGNKRDLAALRQVPEADGRAVAEEEGLAGFYEASAKEEATGGVDAIFKDLAAQLLENGVVSAKAAEAAARRANAVAASRLGELPTGQGPSRIGSCCGTS
ncbi:Rab family, other [Strigomonas culicis]|uniref:Rab family, other n=1 Tax=Strigomonas culicis TaxID=28005 RepID=S9V152_9TRYP|nr:Rab family, other [Strigomonas culicis]|eukprot:EPY34749.1 Rab family, other [Strigomonas culicis]